MFRTLSRSSERPRRCIDAVVKRAGNSFHSSQHGKVSGIKMTCSYNVMPQHFPHPMQSERRQCGLDTASVITRYSSKRQTTVGRNIFLFWLLHLVTRDVGAERKEYSEHQSIHYLTASHQPMENEDVLVSYLANWDRPLRNTCRAELQQRIVEE